MKAVMGLEIHVQLETESKLFCGCSTDSEYAEPNGNTCPICLGFPGAKPKVNRRAVERAVKPGGADDGSDQRTTAGVGWPVVGVKRPSFF